MIRWLTLGVVATALVAAMPLRAEETGAASASPLPQPPPSETGAIPAAQSPAESPAVAADPTSEALRKRLAGPELGATDEERAEYAALLSFYEARRHASLWM